jgi:hypothetical protein
MGEAISIERGRAHVPDELIATVAEQLSHQDSFEDLEVATYELVNEIARRVLGAALQTMADSFGDEVTVDERTYRRHGEGTVRYHTLCGPVAVRRPIYRLVGVHNGPTVVPLEIAAGLRERATPALVSSTLQAFAAMPLREYETVMAAAHRALPSRSTLERISKRAGAQIEDTIAAIEPTIRANEPWLDGVCSISTGLDRAAVPMSEPIPNAEAPNRGFVDGRCRSRSSTEWRTSEPSHCTTPTVACSRPSGSARRRTKAPTISSAGSPPS